MSVRVYTFILLFVISTKVLATTTLELWAGVQLDVVDSAIAAYEENTDVKINVRQFDIENIRAELLLAQNDKFYQPDLIWVPSDFIGLQEHIDLAAIPKNWLDTDKLESSAKNHVILDDQYYGVPVILGNHLVLYSNTHQVNGNSVSWEMLVDMQSTKAMQLPRSNMFFFMSFLTMFTEEGHIRNFEVTEEEWVSAFRFYYKMNEQFGTTASEIGEPLSQSFITGNSQYYIDGDWARGYLSENMGDKLGVMALPSYQGKSMRSFSGAKVIGVTNSALKNEKNRVAIKTFIKQLQNEPFLIEATQDKQFISANQWVNRKQFEENKNFSLMYQQYIKATPMPNTYDMTLLWEALGRANHRYQSGMPVENIGQYIVTFMDKHKQKVESLTK